MKKILVVDDELDILDLIQKRLEENNYQVLTASNAIEAFAKLKDPELGLIILDVMMPEISGYDFCRTIKLNSAYKELPVLFLTARNQEIDPRVSKMMNIHHMGKPFENEELLAKIKSLLGA